MTEFTLRENTNLLTASVQWKFLDVRQKNELAAWRAAGQDKFAASDAVREEDQRKLPSPSDTGVEPAPRGGRRPARFRSLFARFYRGLLRVVGRSGQIS